MFNKRTTYVVLGIFLILTGLMSFVSGLGVLSIIAAILALAAGILILVKTPGLSNNIGWILAAVYLILVGLSGLVNFSFSGMGVMMAVLAIIAGVVLLIDWPGFSHHTGSDLSVVTAIIAIASGILMILKE